MPTAADARSGRSEARRIQREVWLLDHDRALEASRLETTLFERDYDALDQRMSLPDVN